MAPRALDMEHLAIVSPARSRSPEELMVVALSAPGRDWNRAMAISGRAAMPGLPGGSGFSWRSVVGTTGLLRPRAALSGLGAMARRRRGRGLGQDGTDMETTDTGPITDTGGLPPDTGIIPINTTCVPGVVGTMNCPQPLPTAGGSSNPFPQTTSVTAQGASSSSQTPWWGTLLNSLANTGKTITNFELNPLYQKGTYIQTPQGGIIATNNPNISTAGLTTTNLSSMMPLLVIGGGLVVVMMMAKR